MGYLCVRVSFFVLHIRYAMIHLKIMLNKSKNV